MVSGWSRAALTPSLWCLGQNLLFRPTICRINSDPEALQHLSPTGIPSTMKNSHFQEQSPKKWHLLNPVMSQLALARVRALQLFKLLFK